MLKKLKRRLMRRNNGGFTLVEVIVSSALLGVLLVGMIMFISPIMQLMQTEQEDSRGSIIGASIEHYISRSVRSTIFIKTFTNATIDDATSTTGAIATNPDLQKMLKWCEDSSDRYEVRCISIRKTADNRRRDESDIPTSRYMIYQEYFATGSKVLDKNYSLPVFDSCFYGDLYPQVTVKQATNEYSDNRYSDTQIGAPATVEKRPSIEITVDIYDNENLGATDKIFTGYGLTELFMIANKDKMTDGDTKNAQIYEDSKARSDEEAETAHTHDIFIFYVARKVKAPTPPVTPP